MQTTEAVTQNEINDVENKLEKAQADLKFAIGQKTLWTKEVTILTRKQAQLCSQLHLYKTLR